MDLANKITDGDILWFEKQLSIQKDLDYVKIAQMELKIANAIKELQEQIKN